MSTIRSLALPESAALETFSRVVREVTGAKYSVVRVGMAAAGDTAAPGDSEDPAAAADDGSPQKTVDPNHLPGSAEAAVDVSRAEAAADVSEPLELSSVGFSLAPGLEDWGEPAGSEKVMSGAQNPAWLMCFQSPARVGLEMELPLGCEPVVGAMSSLISFDSSAQAFWSRPASSKPDSLEPLRWTSGCDDSPRHHRGSARQISGGLEELGSTAGTSRRAAACVEAVEEVQQHRSRSCSTDTENELEQPQRSVIRLPKISSLFSPPRSANGIQGTEPRRLHARVGLEEVSTERADMSQTMRQFTGRPAASVVSGAEEPISPLTMRPLRARQTTLPLGDSGQPRGNLLSPQSPPRPSGAAASPAATPGEGARMMAKTMPHFASTAGPPPGKAEVTQPRARKAKGAAASAWAEAPTSRAVARVAETVAECILELQSSSALPELRPPGPPPVLPAKRSDPSRSQRRPATGVQAPQSSWLPAAVPRSSGPPVRSGVALPPVHRGRSSSNN